LLREKKRKSKQSNLNMGLVFRVFVGAFFSYIWMLNFQHVNSIEGLQSFDPYAILEIETDADDRAIKKQYRRLSLQLHPDKNPDNPLAVQNFIKLTKAYNILTDETARDNFQKYGNPDGPGSYNVAIAMPKFLLEKDNQVPVLIAAFIILLVIVPGFVYFNFADSTKRSEEGVLLENKRIFGYELSENTMFKNLPVLIAKSKEFQAVLAKSNAENELLKRIKASNDKIDDIIPKLASKKTRQMHLKPAFLILAQMFRLREGSDPILAESMDYIRKMTPQMMTLVSQVISELQQLHSKGQSPKRMPAKVMETCQVF